MRRPFAYDKKLLLLTVFLLLFMTILALIWWHYELELQAIEQQTKELKLKTGLQYKRMRFPFEHMPVGKYGLTFVPLQLSFTGAVPEFTAAGGGYKYAQKERSGSRDGWMMK